MSWSVEDWGNTNWKNTNSWKIMEYGEQIYNSCEMKKLNNRMWKTDLLQFWNEETQQQDSIMRKHIIHSCCEVLQHVQGDDHYAMSL